MSAWEYGGSTWNKKQITVTPPDRGLTTMFLCAAVLGGLIGIIGLLSPPLRSLETG